jgi:hypothetical protein
LVPVSQDGVAPEQSASTTQPTQVWVAVSQAAPFALPVQSPWPRHSTQVSVPVSHTPVAQAWVESQATHRWVVVLQTGAAASVQSPSTAQEAVQVWLPVSQDGVVPPQSPLRGQPTQVWCAVSQTGAAASWQSPLPTQATQLFVAVSQAGVAPSHCALLVQATQVLVAVSHAGVAPLHSLSWVHCTQVRVLWLQTGVSPEQVGEQVVPESTGVFCTQVLLAQTKFAPRSAQSALILHSSEEQPAAKANSASAPSRRSFLWVTRNLEGMRARQPRPAGAV